MPGPERTLTVFPVIITVWAETTGAFATITAASSAARFFSSLIGMTQADKERMVAAATAAQSICLNLQLFMICL